MLRRWENFIIFKDYVFLKKLATGGMARVYLARKKGAHGFEKFYAIKELHDHLRENESFFSMFVQEAKLSSKLDHPNIVKIFDLLGEEEHFFIVMEYAKGKNIRDILRVAAGQKEDLYPIALKITSEMLMGLDFAHNLKDINGNPLNIIHRDISPQNIMVSYEGSVKVTDFGIAKAADNVEETRTGVLKGKVSYMSPEQAFGRKLDRRSDLYSMGIILYEMITLKKCFSGKNSVDILEKVRNGNFIAVDKIVPGINPQLNNILNKALAYSADERYQTAAEFQKDLEDFIFENRIPVKDLNVANLMHKMFEKDIKEEFDELASLSRKIQKIPYLAEKSNDDIETGRVVGSSRRRTKPRKTAAKKQKSKEKKRIGFGALFLNILLMLFIPLLLFDIFFVSYYRDFVDAFPFKAPVKHTLKYRPGFLPDINLAPYYKYREIDVSSPSLPVKYIFRSNPAPLLVNMAGNDTIIATHEESTGIYSIDIMSYIDYNLVFSTSGYQNITKKIFVRNTNTIPHSINLEDKTSTITFKFDPKDAMLYINDQLLSQESPYIYSYNPDKETASHTIKLKKSGYEGIEKIITFSGDSKTYTIALEPKFINVTFRIVPWGIVSAKGKQIGICNKESSFTKRMQAGKYDFTFLYPDNDVQQQVSYNLDKSQTITYNFSKIYAHAFITSYPPQADIYVDDVQMMTTPQQAMPLKAGYHKIVIHKNGFLPCTREINVSPGEEIAIHCDLEKTIE
ncbi:serine/threonine protein kinase [bacterium]|nr:serine/threonine protein kinase [bacterium]